jgi:hypothetical protein
MSRELPCHKCGAAVDEDWLFCNQCGESVAEVTDRTKTEDREPSAAASAPTDTPTNTGKVAMIVGGCVLVLGGVVRLANSSSDAPKIEVIGASAAAPTPPSGPSPESLRAQAPSRPPTEFERSIAGTWVADTGLRARDPAMADKATVSLGAAGTAPCLWLELYDNLTGFQPECQVVDGEPSVLEQVDARSGRKRPLGVAFSWSYTKALELHYATPLVLPAAADGTRLTISDVAFELIPRTQPIEAKQTFPEQPALAPEVFRFEARAGVYLGDPAPAP